MKLGELLGLTLAHKGQIPADVYNAREREVFEILESDNIHDYFIKVFITIKLCGHDSEETIQMAAQAALALASASAWVDISKESAEIINALEEERYRFVIYMCGYILRDKAAKWAKDWTVGDRTLWEYFKEIWEGVQDAVSDKVRAAESKNLPQGGDSHNSDSKRKKKGGMPTRIRRPKNVRDN